MTLRYTNLDEIEERHLRGLVELGISEQRSVEYKSKLPGRSDTEGKEFVSDVCSFANAGGGDIVYGMEEDKGVPTALTGVETQDSDSEILRLDSMILSGVDPRPPGFRSRYISLSNGKYAFVTRIPRSFARPHAVDYKGRFRFYSRNSAGKYEMDVAEIRNAVLAGEAVADRLRSFRLGRLADVVAGEVPLETNDTAALVLHVLPLASFDVPAPSIDLTTARRGDARFLPISLGGNDRYNFDGLLCHGIDFLHGDPGERRPESYVLLFRSGQIEAVDSVILWPEPDGPIIPSAVFEGELLRAMEGYLDLLSRLGIGGPVYVALSMLGVQGYTMAVGRYGRANLGSVDRDTLVVPEVMAESVRMDREGIERLMRPIFDQIWNACGYPGSGLYDENGRWVGDRR